MSNKIAIDQGHVNPLVNYEERTSHEQLNEGPPPYPAAIGPYPATPYSAGPNPAAPYNIQEKSTPYPIANQQDGVEVILAQPVFNVPGGVVVLPPRPPSYLALAIFSCLCCNCCCGLAAILKANETSNLYDRGDYQGAEISSRQAKKWAMISIVCGVILTVVILILRFTVFAMYDTQN